MAEQILDPIDDLLNQLEEDHSKGGGGDFKNIVKLQFAFPDNHGMVMFAPFQSEVDGRKSFYTLVSGVREYKTAIPSIDQGKSETWIRLMPKEFYGKLTDEQSELYDRLSDLFDQVQDKHADEDNAWKFIRVRSYSLFYGVMLKHMSKDGNDITGDNAGKATLFVFPSKAPVNELGTAIKSKTNALNGNRAWVSGVFDASNSARQGALIINFSRPESGAYQSSVSFEFNSQFNGNVVEASYPKEVTELFGDIIADFNGRFNGQNGSKFNSDIFRELGKALTLELSGQAAPAPQPPLENKNGADPMVGSSPASPATSAPVNGSGAAPEVKTESSAPIPGVDKLPF